MDDASGDEGSGANSEVDDGNSKSDGAEDEAPDAVDADSGAGSGHESGEGEGDGNDDGGDGGEGDNDNDDDDDDDDDDDEEEEEEAEPERKVLPVRTTRQKRTTALVGEAAEADAEFWNQKAFADASSDEEFTGTEGSAVAHT